MKPRGRWNPRCYARSKHHKRVELKIASVVTRRLSPCISWKKTGPPPSLPFSLATPKSKNEKKHRQKKINQNATPILGHPMRVGTRTHPSSRGRAAGPVAGAGMNSKSPSSKDSGDDGSKVLPAWLGDLWGLASPQPPPPLSRTSSRTTLPVFFDRDGRVGPTKLWLKETHAVAGLTLDKIDQEKQKQEAELARAAQVALEIAQVRRSHGEVLFGLVRGI